ncbi:MAG: 4-(cytidine 5'-diphospho)-2-C-methyl-D-erythritol kinase [Clostridia bacterium]|nr:4-(cytidine 5'-diphospho)-2-C-methyl-D-erythritol kinase [Clostridia bacterium]
MDEIRVKSPAKINLTLEIVGTKAGKHLIDSVVTTIDLFDVINVKKRKDGLVNCVMHGMGSEYIPHESNNAVRAAELFAGKYGTRGVDITVWKNIPMGAGLGGSSADAAGVLNALKALYGTDSRGAYEIAESVGSDVKYMMTGGYARLTGFGENVTPIQSPLKLYFTVIVPKEGVSTAECYARYDSNPDGIRTNSSAAQKALEEGDFTALGASLYNALYAPARLINPKVGEAVYCAYSFDPAAAAMTGSGSAAYALFENDTMCRWAQSRYHGDCTVFCAKTYIPKNKAGKVNVRNKACRRRQG